jgi:Transglutaminase-like superfamily
MTPSIRTRLGAAAMVAAMAVAAAPPARAQACPKASPDAEARVRFLQLGLFLLYHNLNLVPSDRGLPAELVAYDQVILARYGAPLNIGRVVQLMLFADQVYLHRPGAHGIDGTLVVIANGKRSFLGRDQLERLAGLQAASPPLNAAQLSSMILALYMHRDAAPAVERVGAELADPIQQASALLFLDRADGALDGRLLAKGQDRLIDIFRRSGTQPVVPFSNKRGPGSWVTPQQFIRPPEVQTLLQDTGLPRQGDSEAKLVRKLMSALASQLRAVPDDDGAKGGGAGDDVWSYPRETLRRGRGDCEDLAFVLQSCLEALHVPSHLVFGRIWDPEHGAWLGHVWVEWREQILDLAFHADPLGTVCSARRCRRLYRGVLWFDSTASGWTATARSSDAQDPAPLAAIGGSLADADEPGAELLASRGLGIAPPQRGSSPLGRSSWQP